MMAIKKVLITGVYGLIAGAVYEKLNQLSMVQSQRHQVGKRKTNQLKQNRKKASLIGLKN